MNIKFYQEKLDNNSAEESKLKKKIRRLSFFRLLVFLAGLFLLYLLMKFNASLAISVFLLFLIVFFMLIKRQNLASRKVKDLLNLSTLYHNEISLLRNGNNLFGNGDEFTDSSHPFSSDLDVFGNHSIFESINRAVTNEGKSKMAEWLIYPNIDIDLLKSRQQAISELASMERFKENMLLKSYIFLKEKHNQSSIINWFKGFDFRFIHLRPYRLAFNLATIILLALIPLSFINNYASLLLFASVISSIGLYFYFYRKVNKLHQVISRQGALFSTYSKLVSLINKQHFNTGLLNELKDEFKKPDHISSELKKLAKLIEQLDYRLNAYVAFFPKRIFLLGHPEMHSNRKLVKKK